MQFYTTMIDSVLTSALIICFSTSSSQEKRKLRDTIGTGEEIISSSLKSIEKLCTGVQEIALTSTVTSHHKNSLLNKMLSSTRCSWILITQTACYCISFCLLAVSVNLNQTCKGFSIPAHFSFYSTTKHTN